MKHSGFVHLHQHTEYSLLDGACKLDALIDKAIEYKMPSVAITDHGTMHGVIEFYLKAKEKGIKPIIGCEAYIAPGSMKDKKTHGVKDASFHIVLLVKDEIGYKNLMRLMSLAQIEGFYYKPRIDKQILSEYSKGLIGMSACLKGEISYYLVHGMKEEAELALKSYLDIFGKNDFYLELMDHGIPEQKIANNEMLKLSKKYDVKVVATNDSHYLEKEDAFAHEVLLCVQTGTTLADPNRMKMYNDQFYFKSPEEMKFLFKNVPEAIENTIEIYEKCNLEIDFSKRHMPKYTPPDGKSPEKYLRELCEKGIKRLYPKVTKEIKNRLDHELNIINKMGFPSYFLMVRDIVQFARDNGIMVGPGRGSAAGSIVSYSLGITKIDPLKYNLLFERFLNPDRISMPDIDIDFADSRRGEVINYIVNKYGKENVAQIITFGTLGAKAVIRDVARVLGFSYKSADAIAKLIPSELNITLKKALETEPDLKEKYENDPEVKKLFDIAFKLEGLPRNASTHAAGVIISNEKIWEHVPVCRGQNGEIVTQYSMYPLEKIGMLKMDILGLKTLTVINDAINIIRRTKGIELDLDKIDFNDKKTYELLNKANTIGVFQLESSGMRELCRKIGLSQLEEIIALIALYRPGPMNMLEDYVQRKHGKVKVKYYHPSLEPVLKNTYGIMLYQEQVMQTASVLAGFTLAQADTLRRIMGKKITDKMQEQEEVFIKGALKNNVKKEVAEKVFEAMAYFAGYGFNKSHSTAYAFLAYQTAYLKANYPVEFMASLLSADLRNTDKITKYIEECKNMGIEVLPPDINESYANFTVVGNNIRFGLAAIKNVGEAAVKSIIEARKKEGKFKSLQDFFKRVDPRTVNRKVVESLIKCGAFQSLHDNRAEIFLNLDNLLSYMNASQKDKLNGQISLFSMMNDENIGDVFEFKKCDEWPKEDLLRFEKELLGFYVTGHPLSQYEKFLKMCRADDTESIKIKRDNDEVKIGGIIANLKIAITKAKSEKMAILKLEDLKSNIEVIVFPSVFRKYSNLIIEGNAIFVIGRINLRDDNPKIIAQDIYNLSDLKNNGIKAVFLNIINPQKSMIESLEKLVKNNLGYCPLYLDMLFPDNTKIVIKTGKNKGINPTENTLLKIEELLGEDTIWIKLANGEANGEREKKDRKTFNKKMARV